MVAIRGHFDGKVFVPDGPVDVPRDRPLILHVEVFNGHETGAAVGDDLFAMLDRHAGSIDAPADWSIEHDHFLYGTAKRHEQDAE